MKVIGFLLVIAGVLFGAWAGIWWAFIGGIVNVIDGVRAENVDAMLIAGGIAKVTFAAVIGWLSAIVLMLPGFALMGGKVGISVKRRNRGRAFN